MKKIFYIIIFLMLITESLFADFYNNRNIIPGEKAAMMGGAYTALSEDISGAFYNPAGLSWIEKSSISMSADAFTYKKFTRFRKANSIESETKLNNFEIVPITFGFNFSIGNFATGFSIFQTDKFEFTSLDIDSDGYAQKLEMNLSSYLMGVSASYKLMDSFSFGVSVFYHLSKGKLVFSNESATSIKLTQNETLSGGIFPVIGIKFVPVQGLNIGIKYSYETVHTNGYNIYSLSEVISSSPAATISNGEIDGDIRYPHQIAVGIAYEKKKSYTISFDAIYYFKMEYGAPHEILHTEDVARVHKEIAHFDLSLGGEVFITEKFSLRMGLYTNSSSASASDVPEKIFMYGGSFGIGYTKDGLSSGVGCKVMYGSSDWVVNPDYPAVDSRWERLEITMIVGATKDF